MTNQEELERIIFNELGFAINKVHRSNIATTIISAGYVKKDSIELDEEKIKRIIIDIARKEYIKDKKIIPLILDSQMLIDLAHAIAQAKPFKVKEKK